MAKRRRAWNASVYDRYLREGRGHGSGLGYSPWIRIQDFASQGIASRVKGRTTGRVHHLMSNHELAYFYILDWSDIVIDIREQFPLLDLELAVNLAAQSNIKYPIDKTSGYPYVLTCDFMITTNEGLKARTIKMTSELSNVRILEKLEIERRYWQEKGVNWKIVTEREISFQKAKNIEWLFTSYLEEDIANIPYIAQAEKRLLCLLHEGEHSIIGATQSVEREHLLCAGTGIQIFKQLVLSKKVFINLNERINLSSRGIVA